MLLLLCKESSQRLIAMTRIGVVLFIAVTIAVVVAVLLLLLLVLIVLLLEGCANRGWV
jgi:hypothetical protein